MIRKTPFLERTKSQGIFALKAAGKHCSYREGEAIFSEGQASDFLYYLVEGVVSFSFHDEGGKNFVIGIASEETLIGELEVFTNRPRISSALALRNSEILSIPKQLAIDIIKNDAELLFEILKYYAGQLEYFLRFSLTMEIEKRLALILQELAGRFGESTSLGQEINIKLSQEILASMVGKPRQRINQILKSWESAEWIKVDREKITICAGCDLPALV